MQKTVSSVASRTVVKKSPAFAVVPSGKTWPKKLHATLSDVGRLAGVSRWMAGHVLNNGQGNTRVSESVAQRIRQAAQRLNYRSNQAALQLRGKRSLTFGLLVNSAGDPLRSFLVQYADEEAAKVGCRILIANTAVESGRFDKTIGEFLRRGVDGVLCMVHRWSHPDFRALLDHHPHTVFYENPGVAGAAHVEVDRELAVRLAVRHLAMRDRKRIGLAVRTLSRAADIARKRGYEKELRSLGLTMNSGLIFNGETHGAIFARHNDITKQWDFPFELMDRVIDQLVHQAKADAIVAHNDFWAAALLRRLKTHGIAVPHDVAVVGNLNHYLADWTDPPLTTIDPQHHLAAQHMVRMLEEMIAGTKLSPAHRKILITPRLIERGSS